MSASALRAVNEITAAWLAFCAANGYPAFRNGGFFTGRAYMGDC